MQVAVAFPMRLNPELHVYVALSPTLTPVYVTPPLAGATGTGHFTVAVAI